MGRIILKCFTYCTKVTQLRQDNNAESNDSLPYRNDEKQLIQPDLFQNGNEDYGAIKM